MATADDLYELMSTTRSIRRISDRPVDDDVLARVLTACTWAPSGGNRQPWRVIAVRDHGVKQRIADLYTVEWDRYVEHNLAALGDVDDETRERVRTAFGTGTRLARNLAQVPAVAMFVHDPSALYVTDSGLGRHPVVGGASLYPAVQNLLLALRAEGLGGVLTTLICGRETELRAILGLPDGWGVHAMVPLGWPEGRHGPLSRAPLSRMAMVDRWSTPFPD